MEEVSVLIGKSQSGDKEAREVLIEKNLGLVHHLSLIHISEPTRH